MHRREETPTLDRPQAINSYKGFLADKPGFNQNNPLVWHVEDNRLVCEFGMKAWLIGLALCCLLGPVLTALWLLKWPLLMEIIRDRVARGVFYFLQFLGWIGVVKGLFYSRRVTFDFVNGSVHFFSRASPRVDWSMPLDEVAGYRICFETHRYRRQNVDREYRGYFLELRLRDGSAIRLFEIFPEVEVMNFGNLLAQMSGRPIEHCEVA